MIPWLKALLYDPKSFSNFIRAGVFALGSVPELTGAGGSTGWWLGKLVQIAAFAIRAGDKNL